ncbi:MAG: hypothetical protein QM778_25095 [Myxococcales bacterium]
MPFPQRAAARRPSLLRTIVRGCWRLLWRALRILALVMIAVSPNAPPPPLPRPPPIEARAEEGEGDEEEP